MDIVKSLSELESSLASLLQGEASEDTITVVDALEMIRVIAEKGDPEQIRKAVPEIVDAVKAVYDSNPPSVKVNNMGSPKITSEVIGLARVLRMSAGQRMDGGLVGKGEETVKLERRPIQGWPNDLAAASFLQDDARLDSPDPLLDFGADPSDKS